MGKRGIIIGKNSYGMPDYAVQNRYSPGRGAIVIKDTFYIHAGPASIQDVGFGSAGCIEIIGNYDTFKKSIADLSGHSVGSPDMIIQQLVNFRKLIITIQAASPPNFKNISPESFTTEGGIVKILYFAIVLIFSILSAPAQPQAQILKCINKMPPISDDRLQRSVLKLKQMHPEISFQTDDNPCQQARDTIKALTKTLGRNYLKNFSGYEYVKIINGDEYFTVERFKSKNPKDLQALATGLRKKWSHKLKIEANTSYEYFLDSDNIVIMISSATGRKANSRMFQEVLQTFTSSATK